MLKVVVFCIWVGALLGGGICEDDEDSFLPLSGQESNEAFEDDGILFTNSIVSPNCRRDIYECFRGIKNQERWALAMLDSMEKFPSGLLLGRRTAIGQFDECLDVVHPNFTGQHCLVDIALKQTSSNFTLQELPSMMQRLLGQFTYGVCLPSTCTSADLKNALQVLGLNEILITEVNENGCHYRGFLKFRTKDYFVMVLFSILILLTAASTAYEVHHVVIKKKEIKRKVLTSFSLRSNLKLLFKINENFTEMNVLYGMRFLSFAWVVLGHFCNFQRSLGVEVNTLFKLRVANQKSAIPATNAYVSVDTFFFLSGVLACFVFFRNVSEKGSYDAPVALIHRYLRLTPSLAAVVLFNFTILSHTNAAPYSKMLFQKTETACRDYWWTYFLYVQNIYYQDAGQCFAPAWYLSADMQMFLVSPTILYVLLLWPKIATKYLCALILGSSLTSFVTSYIHDLAPNRIMELIKTRLHTVNEYVWFHTRMTSWLVGVATGYAICGIRSKKITFRPKKIWVAAGWLASAILCLSSLYGIGAFLPIESSLDHSKLEKSAYRAFHRLGWTLGLSWIVIACVSDYGGPVNSLLSLNIFQPLSKLSYCAFLIHHTLQMCRSANDYKSLKYLDSFQLIYTYLGDLTLSIIFSIPMTLLIEMPFCHMEKILLQKLKILPFPKLEKTKS